MADNTVPDDGRARLRLYWLQTLTLSVKDDVEDGVSPPCTTFGDVQKCLEVSSWHIP